MQSINHQKSNLMITVLPALYGDSILISFHDSTGITRNILVDGGLIHTYKYFLKKRIQDISTRNECVDLIILTHNDHDHISGIIKLLQNFGNSHLVNEVWFNNVEFDYKTIISDNKLSYKEGKTFTELLTDLNIKNKSQITTELGIQDFFGLKMHLLTPLLQYLVDFQKNGITEQEYATFQLYAQENDYNKCLTLLSELPFAEDSRIDHQVCISFILEFNTTKILFPSDCQPSILSKELINLGYNENNKIKLSYSFLPHHGSKYNLNEKLISMIECNNFIVSANGENRYSFPHKETFARILNNKDRDLSKKIYFYFNYGNELLCNMFSEEERIDFNFECVFPEIGQNGITIFC